MDWEGVIEKYKIQLGIVLGGLILLGLGVIFFRLNSADKPKIEIISPDSSQGAATIFVDIQGAVEKPGVYELPANSRINDLLIRAGGLSAEADREWVSKNINLAQKLQDSSKIYIPSQKEVRQFGGPALSTTAGGEVAGISGTIAGKININTASQAQLESLWGIGEKRAADIIANRPYQSIEELVTKAKIPKSVVEKIKEKITIY
jgi:competence protein ComEA